MVGMIVLVMAEYLADSPLWFRGGSEVDRSDVDDAAALGVSAALRDDLRAWNDRFEQLSSHVFDDRHDPEVAPDPAPPELWDAHRVEAFELAARAQLELGDDVHVWCGGGGGMDAVAARGPVVVVPSGRRGTDVEVLHQGVREVRSARAAGAREGTAKAIVHWRALTERFGLPFGDAATRALGLRTAGRVQADLGSRARVVCWSGWSGPYRHDDHD
ncbi:hypothetical protein [Curtobacterium luteum]|uniref:hypothetical protein n=1 Tax=Curtobacterium luteum TaxID=33881 RepID=UPI00381F3E65